MRRLGLRRKSDRYWQAERRFGLGGADHLSIYSWSEQAIPGASGPARFLVELTDKGRRALSGIEPRRRAWATETAGQVETEQLEHAVAVLARLRAAPRPVDPFPPDAATSP